jgi:hypothetical protein
MKEKGPKMDNSRISNYWYYFLLLNCHSSEKFSLAVYQLEAKNDIRFKICERAPTLD